MYIVHVHQVWHFLAHTAQQHTHRRPWWILYTLLNSVRSVCSVCFSFHLNLLLQLPDKIFANVLEQNRLKTFSTYLMKSQSFARLLLWLFPQDCRSLCLVQIFFICSPLSSGLNTFFSLHTQHPHMNAAQTKDKIQRERKKSEEKQKKSSEKLPRILTFLHGDGIAFSRCFIRFNSYDYKRNTNISREKKKKEEETIPQSLVASIQR